MWNERYARPGYFFGTEPARFLQTHQACLGHGKTALCVADGEGRNSVFLAQNGLQVTAFDYAPNAIEKAKTLAKEKQVKIDFNLSDLESWNWEAERYDIVVAIFIQFLSPDERSKMFKNFLNTLKPNGLLLLHGYTPNQIEFNTGGPKTRENLYTESMLKTAFSNTEILHLKAYEKVIQEGTGHAGISALIDLVARKK